MQCIRCIEGEAHAAAHAPDGSGAWTIYVCPRCNFGWRSSEPEQMLDPARRRPEFQLDGVDLDALLAPCPIPPLAQECAQRPGEDAKP